MISKEPTFSTSQGKMFKRFVLTWLSSYNMAPLSCTPKHADGQQPELEIPSCGCDDAHKICGSLNDLSKTIVNTFPFCFLPSSGSFPTADTIVITKQSIITIQVTIARSHDSVASDWLASFSTNCHFLVNNSRNKIVKNLKIFMDIDHLRSRGVFCQL